MDLQNIIRMAREISDRTGVITFDQLSELCPKQLEPEDVEALMAALNVEGIRLADDKAQGSDPACSFCGKARPQVLQLVAGAQGFICNECVQLCVQLIYIEHPEWLPEHRKFVDGLTDKP
jgi:ClpX C4-type zinc finger